jgi:hypothetical protein
VALTGDAPEGGVSDGKGKIFINLEDKSAIDVVDTKTWKVVGTYPITACDGPRLRCIAEADLHPGWTGWQRDRGARRFA